MDERRAERKQEEGRVEEEFLQRDNLLMSLLCTAVNLQTLCACFFFVYLAVLSIKLKAELSTQPPTFHEDAVVEIAKWSATKKGKAEFKQMKI